MRRTALILITLAISLKLAMHIVYTDSVSPLNTLKMCTVRGPRLLVDLAEFIKCIGAGLQYKNGRKLKTENIINYSPYMYAEFVLKIIINKSYFTSFEEPLLYPSSLELLPHNIITVCILTVSNK